MRRARDGMPAGSRAGFTLLEALAALVVTALFVAVVVPYAGRLVARWAIGQSSIVEADAWMQAVARMSDDLAEALPLGLGPEARLVSAFRAGETTIEFVRPGLTRPETLETVGYAVRPTATGASLVRYSRPFEAGTFGLGAPRGDPVTLLDGPFELRLVEVASDGVRARGWAERRDMPAAVELSIRAKGRGTVPAAPIEMPISARSPAVGADAPPESQPQ